MKELFQKSFIRAFVAALALCLITVSATAQQKKSTLPLKRANDAARHSRQAAQVFNRIMVVPDKAVP